ncbi:MAG: dienelactone hydrolase family protein [Planctomycetes bacterium]|nr:dienelactone hydrolase family protein [Planctomycetota bacterium]MCB9904685.1 dienelactone hydrolase family protein [Planctomycetota bacterium]
MSPKRVPSRRLTDRIPFLGDHVDALSALWDLPAEGAESDRAVLLAHGAGAPMDTPLLEWAAQSLAEAGVPVLRFLYPYTERARREERRLPPDRAPVLLASHRAAAQVLRGRFPDARWIFGGKSMGGRMSSMLAAEGDALHALFFLGYPLHPAGKPERERSEHFGAIELPALFLQGDRDALCELPLLESALQRFSGDAHLHVVRGADHGFDVRKRDGRTPDDVRQELRTELLAWLDRALPPG